MPWHQQFRRKRKLKPNFFSICRILAHDAQELLGKFDLHLPPTRPEGVSATPVDVRSPTTTAGLDPAYIHRQLLGISSSKFLLSLISQVTRAQCYNPPRSIKPYQSPLYQIVQFQVMHCNAVGHKA